jgi:hypothetical protein
MAPATSSTGHGTARNEDRVSVSWMAGVSGVSLWIVAYLDRSLARLARSNLGDRLPTEWAA